MVGEAAGSTRDKCTFKMRSQTFNVPAGFCANKWVQWEDKKTPMNNKLSIVFYLTVSNTNVNTQY